MAAAALLAAAIACAPPPIAAVAAPQVPIEPGCYLVDGSADEENPPLPSHLILTAEPSAEAADRRAVRLRCEGERVDDAGWWHRGMDAVVVLFDPARSGGFERWSIAVAEGEIRARFVSGGRTRSARLFAGCD